MRALALLLFSLPALGQIESFDADRYRPVTDREGFLNVKSGSVAPHLAVDVGIFATWLTDPLAVQDDSGGKSAVVGDRITGRLLANFAAFDSIAIGFEFPYTLLQNGDVALGPAELPTSGPGDMRVVPKVQLLHHGSFGVDVAASAEFTLPTATPDAFLGAAAITVAPELAVSRQINPQLRLAINLGAHLVPNTSLLADETGPYATYRLGAQYRLDAQELPFGLSVALSGATQFRANRNPLEALFAFDYIFLGRLKLGVGGGVGLLSAPGQADFRAYSFLRYAI